jgi:hypothetical protein
MTKAENRAAAKAYQAEKLQRMRDEMYALEVAEDLKHLAALRRYLILGRTVHVPGRDLTEAIDDYVEKLTGNRTACIRKPLAGNRAC